MAPKDPALDSDGCSARPLATEVTFVVECCPEGGFTARAVGHSVFAEGETLDRLKADILSAVACHFSEENAPALIRFWVGGEQVVLKR